MAKSNLELFDKAYDLTKHGVKTLAENTPEVVGVAGGGVAGGMGGAGALAATGFLVAGPAGAAIGFAAGFTVGTLGGSVAGFKLGRWTKNLMR